jgi:hypothetical protein
MADYVRVARFEADEAALAGLVDQISAADTPPEGLPATRITVLADRAAGSVVVATRFASEEDLRIGSATLEAMNPAGETMRRVSVESFEVVLDRQA